LIDTAIGIIGGTSQWLRLFYL